MNQRAAQRTKESMHEVVALVKAKGDKDWNSERGMTEKALGNNNTSFHHLNPQSIQCSFSQTLWGHL